MDFSRINRTHVFIVGAVIIVLSCTLIYFLFISGIQASLGAATAYAAGMEKDSGPQALTTAYTAATKSAQQLAMGQLDHMKFVARNPTFVVSADHDVQFRMWPLQVNEVMLNMPAKMRLGFDRNTPTLTVTSTWTFPPPPVSASATFATSPITFKDAGTVTLHGTYPAIEAYMQQIGRVLPRICTLGPLTLNDTRASNARGRDASPWVDGSFTVTVYEFIPGVPESAPAAAAPGPGGPPPGAGPPGAGPPAGGAAPPASAPPAKDDSSSPGIGRHKLPDA